MDIGIKFKCKIKQHYELMFSRNKARFLQKQ